MVIEELHVKNFGKLQDTKVPLQEGLNLIYGPNESGKTTLHTFLKCMLFGIHRAKGKEDQTDVYARYEPWEYSDYYAGSIRFSSGGKVFCLDRNFHKDNVTAELFRVTDGEKLPMKLEELTTLLGNISEVVYDDTISVGQSKGVTDQDLALELKNYMGNYQGTGDSDLDLDKTLQILKGQKKTFEKELQLKKAQEESQKNELTSQLLYLRQENQEFHKKIQLEQQQLTQLEQQQKGSEPPKILKKKRFQRRVLDIFLILIIVLTAAAAVFLAGWIRIGSVLTGVLLEGGGLFLYRKIRKKALAIQERLKEDREILARQIGWIKSRLHTQEKSYQEKIADQKALTQKLHQYHDEFSHKDPIEEEIQGIKMAMEAIGVVGQRLQKQLDSQICERTSNILAELTNGTYHQVMFNKDLQMGVASQQRYIPVEQLSRGTMEQVYFALRMAVGDILCSQEPLPVIFDDVFVMYDEKRLMETLQWLIAHKQQVLLFTCHKREQQILDAYGMSYHRVRIFDS